MGETKLPFDIDSIVKVALGEIREITEVNELEKWRVKYFGRKGIFAMLTTSIPEMEQTLRPVIGARINSAKKQLNEAYEERQAIISSSFKEASRFEMNLTLPGLRSDYGSFHPITLVSRQIVRIFQGLGFGVHTGPEIETDFYNFEALNTPADHPARDMWDTFYLDTEKKFLLRTHTSPVQIRVLEKMPVPLRIIAIGRTFRRDAFDASHSPVFHQVEGLMVGYNITFSNLKAVLSFFLKELFGPEIKVRFLPSYFPFTEPSAEISISCVICKGKGCQTCSSTGWLEILGAGMVHPEVFRKSGLKDNKLTGFAFGAGIDRITMIKYGIDDIRLLFFNDIRFLKQFR